MSQEGYESSSSSEDEGEFGLSSYMFEPKRNPAEVENLLKELELKQNRPQDDSPPRNTRIGNIDLCLLWNMWSNGDWNGEPMLQQTSI